jgi:hypothetical protein
MPPYNSSQKQAIAQFVDLTQEKDSSAAKVLCYYQVTQHWGYEADNQAIVPAREWVEC